MRGEVPELLSEQQVREHLPPATAISAMREIMTAVSAGEVIQPVRTVLRGAPAPGALTGAPAALFGSMPAQIPVAGERWFGIKSVVVNKENPRRGLPSHVGTVTVFSPDTGLPLAVLPASVLTELRTAAVSAVATDVLAAPDARVLAVLGAGDQAYAHLAPQLAVRPFERITVWNRTPEKAAALAHWARTAFGVEAVPCASLHDATRGAQVICTTTASSTPFLEPAAVDAGTHINAVGACQPGARELASELVAASAVFLDEHAAAMAEASELLEPGKEGLLDPARHPRGELGAVLGGTVPGRTGGDEITAYLSLGLAAQDVAAAVAVVRSALAGR
ncbi:ornithine cyclodeaminase family protein [Streptomyces tubercidicus]|uniref:ornithine cyclodeaminase family protein n=1 Tax=Streptomyces tubercidicus TaxID=47759 RepID=UPI0036916D5F